MRAMDVGKEMRYLRWEMGMSGSREVGNLVEALSFDGEDGTDQVGVQPTSPA